MNYTDFDIGKYAWKFPQEFEDKIYYTSDTHFLHENILGYCSRPFKNIEEHDEALIKRWNEKVPEDGLVFHLGDVGMGKSGRLTDILSRLNGYIYLIIGNHDWRDNIAKQSWRFLGMTQQVNMTVGGQQIILNHYPLACFSGSYRKKPVWQLYGHIHTSPYSTGVDVWRMAKNLLPNQYDVGVDNNDFTPLSHKEVKEIIDKAIAKNDPNKIVTDFEKIKNRNG